MCVYYLLMNTKTRIPWIVKGLGGIVAGGVTPGSPVYNFAEGAT